MKTNASPEWKRAVAAALDGAARVAVCGIGNDLRGDDAAGALVLRRLQKNHARAKALGSGSRKPVIFIDGGESPENQTGRIRNFQPDLVLLIDATRGGRTPGDIFIVDPERIADDEVSTHRISLTMLARFIAGSIGARVYFIGLEPGATGVGEPVSEAVNASVSTLADYLSAHL